MTTTQRLSVTANELQNIIDTQILEKCQWVVCDSTFSLSVGVENDKAIVRNTFFPTQWKESDAKELAKEIKARNGNGEIVWQVVHYKEYAAKRLAEVNETLELLTEN
jgi:hypothetical protein